MNKGINFKSEQLADELRNIATTVHAIADNCQGDSLALLALMRQLELLHREIREGLFHASLPDNRQALYALLKDIEAEGGWPYIERMKLQAFLANLLVVEATEESEDTIGTVDDKPLLAANDATKVNDLENDRELCS